MDKAGTVFGLVILSFGVFMMKETLNLPYYLEDTPGPGFMPFWVFLVMIILGLVITASSARSRVESVKSRIWPSGAARQRLALVVGSMTLFILLFEPVGFVILTSIFVLVGILGLGMRSWRVLITVPVVSALMLYGLFGVWLRVPLPKGILGILG